jgi:hypothetical protein
MDCASRYAYLPESKIFQSEVCVPLPLISSVFSRLFEINVVITLFLSGIEQMLLLSFCQQKQNNKPITFN